MSRSNHREGKTITGFKTVKLLKDQVLGIGSYGKVSKAKCDDLLCAAKLIHETFFDPTAQQLIAPQREHRLPMRRFEQECEFLSTIRHPNIVQHLGFYRDPDTGLPALLMELMDDNLTHYLESSTQLISYHIQVNICHDITLALSFLHSNNIVHRDLSSNNVLLIGNAIRAKVTDFGMARLSDESSRATQLTFTMCPGTDVYMPPEAVQDKPVYTEKIDCFSFGVITLQILTCQFPKPGDCRKRVEINHPGLPSGTYEMVVSETERRQNHISRIDPEHTLLQVALICLKDRDVERPSAQQLCERVAALKESVDFTESVRVAQETNSPEQRRDGEREREITYLRQQNLELKESIQDQLNHLEVKNQALKEKDDIIMTERLKVREKVVEISQLEREKNQVIEEKERQLKRVNQQLEESEQVIAQFERRITELEQQRPTTDVSSRSEGESSSSRARIKMTWREGRKAPCKMNTSYNAVADDTALYVRAKGKKVYAYLASTFTWSQLPDSPTINCPSVIVNNLLTLVGGHYGQISRSTNVLFSLTEEYDGSRKWTLKFPPMPTERHDSTALCTRKTLIVAGGKSGLYSMIQTVEVMNMETLQWSIAADLPEPMSHPPCAVCGDLVYILHTLLETNTMYTCPVSTLIQSCRSTPTANMWNKVAAPPVTSTACVSMYGLLLTVGGKDSDNDPTTTVYVYNPSTNSWGTVSHMIKPRYYCFAAVLPNNHLIVVGGSTDGLTETDSVELATVELQH